MHHIPRHKILFDWTTRKAPPFRIAHANVLIPDLPDSFHGYRIVHLSDIHFGSMVPAEHVKAAFTKANELKPDLLLLSGDLVQISSTGVRHFLIRHVLRSKRRWRNYRKEVRKWASHLAKLCSFVRPADGVYSVLGNHEYHEGRGTITHALRGWTSWLINSSVYIQKDDACIQLVGLDDLRYGQPDLETALLTGQASTQNPCMRIILCHNPDTIIPYRSYLENEPYLILTGHTHGGQIRLPIIGAAVTRTKQRRYVRDMHSLGASIIYINSGVGWGGIPLRLNCPPELGLITLNRQ